MRWPLLFDVSIRAAWTASRSQSGSSSTVRLDNTHKLPVCSLHGNYDEKKLEFVAASGLL